MPQLLGSGGKVFFSFKQCLTEDLPVFGLGGPAMGSSSSFKRANHLLGYFTDG